MAPGVRALIVALLVLVACAACRGPAGRDQAIAERLYDVLAGAEVGDLVDIKEVIGDDWDRLVIMEGEHLEDDVTAALGFPWPGYEFGSIGEGALITLVTDEQVTRWAYLPEALYATGRRVQVFFSEAYWIEIDPANTSVQVRTIQNDGPIEICYPLCPAR